MATTEQRATYESGLVGVEATRFIGERIPRKEDARLLSGRGRYVDDVVLPACSTPRSSAAPSRATITAIDTTKPRRLDGVRRRAHVRRSRGAVGRPIAGPRGTARSHGTSCASSATRSCWSSRRPGRSRRTPASWSPSTTKPRPALMDRRRAIDDDEHFVHAEFGSNVLAHQSAEDPGSTPRSRRPPHVVTERIASTGTSRCRWRRGAWSRAGIPEREMAIWISTQGAHMARGPLRRRPRTRPAARARDRGRRRRRVRPEDQRRREETAIALAARLLAVRSSGSRTAGRTWCRRRTRAGRKPMCRSRSTPTARSRGAGRPRVDPGAYAGPGAGGACDDRAVARRCVQCRTSVGRARPRPRTPRAGAPTAARGCSRRLCARRWSTSRRAPPARSARGAARNVIQQADLPFTTSAGAAFDRITPAETLEQAVDDHRLRRVPPHAGRGPRRRSLPRHRHRLLHRAHRERVRHRVSPKRPRSASTSAARCRCSPAELAGSQHRDHARAGCRRASRRRHRRHRP